MQIGPAFIALPKLVAFAGALVTSALMLLIVTRTDLGRAIRAVAKEKQGAKLMGIDVDHVYAMSFGIGLACLGAAACFLLPAYYVNPQVGAGFVLVAFTIVVLGGMGSFAGALLGGLLIGVVESLGGLFLGESLGQIGIFAIFIAVLLLRPHRPVRGREREPRRASASSIFALAVLALTLWLTSGVWLNALMMTLYAALLALAWNLLGGFGGQFSFGHALFFGVGAYARAVLQVAHGVNAWAALLGSGADRRCSRCVRRRAGVPLRPQGLVLRAGDAGLRRGVPHPRGVGRLHRRRRRHDAAAKRIVRQRCSSRRARDSWC